MSAAASPEYSPFAGGPPQALETWLGLIRGGKPRLVRGALLAVAVGWLPLALLTAVHGDFIGPEKANSFLLDFGIHTRFLVALPLLILAEAVCVPRLAAIARQFVDADLIAEADRHRYDSAVVSSQRLMNSRVTELALALLAYALLFPVVMATPAEEIGSWHGRLSPFAPFPAGWWVLLISAPLLLWLVLGWLWRICVWTRFLWLMNRLQLQLVPAHPDHAGGLRFVGSSLEGFAPIGFIVGVLGAGPVANQVVHHQANPLQFKAIAIGAVIIVLVLFTGPLLIFTRRLIEERHRGMLQYGALALHMGGRFELKWLRSRVRVDQGAPDMSEFTGTNALYSITANAQAVQILPLEIKSVGLLIVATLLPFVPVWLLAVPFSEIAKELGGFLLL